MQEKEHQLYGVLFLFFYFLLMGVGRDLAKFEPLNCRQTGCSPPSHPALLQLISTAYFTLTTPLISYFPPLLFLSDLQ